MFTSNVQQKLRARFTMSNVEAVTHGWLMENHGLLNEDGYVDSFLLRRLETNLQDKEDHWMNLETTEKVLLAIGLLDGEATHMLKQIGGIQ